MSKVISIALKDMKLRFGSKAELLFFLILPLVFTLILSGVLFSDEAGKIVMVMVDEDNS
jgi:ABC-type Na+ efflux pump permease subunit